MNKHVKKLDKYINKTIGKLIEEKRFEMPWYNTLGEYQMIEAYNDNLLTPKQVKKFVEKVQKASKIKWNFASDEDEKFLNIYMWFGDDNSAMATYYEMYQEIHDTDLTPLSNLSESMECSWEITDITTDEIRVIIHLLTEIGGTYTPEEEMDLEEEE